jgi:hypothetical protein
VCNRRVAQAFSVLARVFDHKAQTLDVGLGDVTIFEALRAQGFDGFKRLMAVVDVLDRLFESDGDDEADDDGGDVEEEVFPCVSGLVRGMDIKHVLAPAT